MIYRILKNHNSYKIQKKKWGIWWHLDVRGRDYHILRFFGFIANVDKYSTLENAQKAIERCIQDDKKDTKYRVVEVVRTHDSPLFKAINKDSNE